MDNKKNITFMFALLFILVSAFFFATNSFEVDAADVFLTNATNNTLNFTVLSGGNFTINVTFSNLTVAGNTTADENNGTGAPINVTLAYACERSSSFTDLATRLNTSANQTQFSFGINTSTLEDCNMTFRARGFNDTAGGTLLRTGEVNRSDVYINNSILVVSITTTDLSTSTTRNGSFVLDITTDEQAANATFVINNNLVTMVRTNSSGVAWNGAIADLPSSTYTYTVNVRDFANDLITLQQTVNIKKVSGGLVISGAGGTTPTTGGTGGGSNMVPILITLAVVWFLFFRGS